MNRMFRWLKRETGVLFGLGLSLFLLFWVLHIAQTRAPMPISTYASAIGNRVGGSYYGY